jgi:elongation factor P
MLSTSDFRVGSTFDFDGKLVSVVAVEHIKMARAGAVIKAKLRNILDGGIFEQSFRSGDKYKVVRIEKTGATYLYNDGDLYHFMDDENYEQVAMNGSQLEGVLPFLKDGSPVSILRYEDKVIGVELPINVELRITETEPGIRGDTVSASFKPAKLETGASVNVPLFVNQGDVIKIDTRTGSYMERV